MEPRRARRLAHPGARRLAAAAVLAAAGLVFGPPPALAQLDPLLFLQRNQPNVIIAMDVSHRMQRDAAGNYYDPFNYPKIGAAWEDLLGVSDANTSVYYRRVYRNLTDIPLTLEGDTFTADLIQTVGDRHPLYTAFWARTRLSVARTGLLAAVQANDRVARFGLLKMRQSNPRVPAMSNEGPVYVAAPAQLGPTETGSLSGRWMVTRPIVDLPNGSIAAEATPVVRTDLAWGNISISTILTRTVDQPGALIPAGQESAGVVDAPLASLIDDARAEAARLIAADDQCRNTVVILVTGGGEGTTSGGADPAAHAANLLNVNGRRVPIYVIAIAPPADDVATLQAIARNSGGGYYEITSSMIQGVLPGMIVPEVTRAANAAVQHAFASFADVNTAPTVALPLGPQTEWQAASPIVGTVNLENARDINGLPLPNTIINTPAGTKIPQRTNVMITAGMALPGFEGRLRAFRMYKPEADVTKPYGWAFVSDGTRLWVSSLPAPAQRNIYTTLP
jgi:hypothetical protein